MITNIKKFETKSVSNKVKNDSSNSNKSSNSSGDVVVFSSFVENQKFEAAKKRVLRAAALLDW